MVISTSFSFAIDDIDEKCRYVIHDHGNSFGSFDFILKSQGIKISAKTPPKVPMCNAFAERFVREARETLNQIIPLEDGIFAMRSNRLNGIILRRGHIKVSTIEYPFLQHQPALLRLAANLCWEGC